MRILVENGCYHLRNMGDVAMLQVAVARLSRLWPEARIQVITDDPLLLARYCPTAHPVLARGRRMWFKNRRILSKRFYHSVPDRLGQRCQQLERKVWNRWPWVACALVRRRLRRQKVDPGDMEAFVEAVLGADLIVFSGGGDINDAFKEYAVTVLDIFEMAAQRGTPTAMVGQGMGPIQNPMLRDKAKAVLPSINLIAIRESRMGPVLLSSLGVTSNHVITTGDDAIELAYEAHAQRSGTGIGINLRRAMYSEVNSSLIGTLRAVLHCTAQKYSACLVPLPISFHNEESDISTIQMLLTGCQDLSIGEPALDDPLNIIERAGQCRVVVTGSYHSAVFALAQGIPAVCVAKSAYYIDKFLGLAHQFGAGCEVVLLDDKDLCEKLAAGIDNAWRSAEQVRPQLLEAAKQQVELSRVAYQRVYELVESRKAKAAKA